MKETSSQNPRRSFLKGLGLSTIPFLVPTSGIQAMELAASTKAKPSADKPPVNFIFDGLFLSPSAYLEKLQEINSAKPIEKDFYGRGGTVQSLEKAFAKLTGKQKAIYLPSGTMANQLALKLLNGNNTKVIVPENSHIFRDEADAAQSVHNKRLIPIGEDKAFFNLADLEEKIEYLGKSEVFKSGLGTIAIENPVRRADGRMVPLATIKEVSAYCKTNGYKLHLDGARIHLAAAYSGISLQEYASYFDTVYISLYKYLNATAGAILCGDAEIIDQISHQVKILGGAVFQNWANAAVALHYLEGIEKRWEQVVSKGAKLMEELNKMEGVRFTPLEHGTNIFDLQLAANINLKKLANFLYTEHNMRVGRANKAGIVKFSINESILTRSSDELLAAWETGIQQAAG